MPHQDEPALDPSTTSATYDAMFPSWQKVQTLLDGTDAMRAAGQARLPQHQNEDPDCYADRLSVATLLNLTQLTLDSWVGRPFSDPIRIDDDVPEEMKEILDDVDLQGNAVGVFARGWFREGLAKAVAHVLVDFPFTERAVMTMEDEREMNLRPYWSFIRPEDLIFAEATIMDGREILTHIRIQQNEVQRVGFTEMLVQRIRVFDRVIPGETPTPVGMELTGDAKIDIPLLFGEDGAGGTFMSIWILQEGDDGEEDKWVLEFAPTRIDIDEIPLVTFYADRDGLVSGKPPLLDLADLNIRHWQSQSDQINILTTARFPLLAMTGVDPDTDVIEIGPRRALGSTNENAKFLYVEHTGKAIGAGRQDLQDLEEQMANYGAEFLKKRPGDQTATARALDSAEATSPIRDATVRFNDALARAKALTAKWMGVEDQGVIAVSVDFGPEDLEAADMRVLSEARKQRDLSQQDFLAELSRRGALSDTFNFEVNKSRLAAEKAAEPSAEPPVEEGEE